MGLEVYPAQMSSYSCLTFMMIAPWRATGISEVAQREAESCSWMKTGQKLCGLTFA